MAWTVANVGKLRPSERGGHAMACVDTAASVFVVGGTSRELAAFNDVWKLEHVDGTYLWSKFICHPPVDCTTNSTRSPPADFVAARVHATATVISSKVFLIGGYSPETGIVYNDVAVLDVDEGRWSWPQVRGEVPEPFHSHSAALLPRGRILIFGGKIEHDRHTNESYILDTNEMVWRKLQPTGRPPCAREMHTAVAVRPTRLLIYGGRDSTGVLSDAILFDAVDMHWEKRVETAHKSVGHTAVVTPDGDTLVYGGFSGSDIEGHLLRISKSLEVEILSDAQSAAIARRLHGGAVPPPRFGHSAAIIPRQASRRSPSDSSAATSSHTGVDQPCGSPKPEGDATVTPSTTEAASDVSQNAQDDAQRLSSKLPAHESEAEVQSLEGEDEAADILLSLSQSRGPLPGEDPVADAVALDLASVLSSLSISGNESVTRSNGDNIGSSKERLNQSESVGTSSGWQMLVFGGATTEQDLNDIAIWDPQAPGCRPGEEDSTVEIHLQEI